MRTSSATFALACCCVLWACSSDSNGSDSLAHANAGSPAPEPASQPLTYWKDMAPLFAEHCMRCHRDAGIAPFRLDDYAQAKTFAKLIEKVTRERSMPPWSVTSDGSCGDFADSEALNDDEIARISTWVRGGALEGTRRSIEVPEAPRLTRATELETPDFLPVIQGGELAEFDEYRCFMLDAPTSTNAFITGYDVEPGTPEIVHHVLVAVVDPGAPAEDSDLPGQTNLDRMRALDAESPDRDGWPCFGMAGDGVSVDAAPVVWAPGQGTVKYPDDSGIRLHPSDKLVIQVHYNLADERQRGKRDQTTVHVQIVPKVKNVAMFVLQDSLLASLEDEQPLTLPAGQRSTIYTWSQTAEEMGLEGLSEAQLYGVMPHMHQLGRKYRMTISSPGEPERCAADVQHWDFHWQRQYFYAKPMTIKPDTTIRVTCDYDTSSVTQPVKPGWGTRNEMCLAALFVTVPSAALR